MLKSRLWAAAQNSGEERRGEAVSERNVASGFASLPTAGCVRSLLQDEFFHKGLHVNVYSCPCVILLKKKTALGQGV